MLTYEDPKPNRKRAVLLNSGGNGVEKGGFPPRGALRATASRNTAITNHVYELRGNAERNAKGNHL